MLTFPGQLLKEQKKRNKINRIYNFQFREEKMLFNPEGTKINKQKALKTVEINLNKLVISIFSKRTKPVS